MCGLNFSDALSLLSLVVSLVLSGFAIWLSIVFKRESDRVNSATTLLLVDIRSDAKAISSGIMSEFSKTNDALRGNFANNQATGKMTFNAAETRTEG